MWGTCGGDRDVRHAGMTLRRSRGSGLQGEVGKDTKNVLVMHMDDICDGCGH